MSTAEPNGKRCVTHDHGPAMRNVTLVALCVAAAGCVTDTYESASSTAPVGRDSAGITIVENPPNADLARWTVDSAPSLTLGVAEGDSTQEFGTIGRIAQLNNAMIVVLDGRGETAFEFRIFDSTGKHVATHGRFGRGPGEFTWVNHFGSAGVAGDTIYAVDFPNRRLNYLTVANGFARSLQFDEVRLKALLGGDAAGLVEMSVPFDDSTYAIKAYRPSPGATDHRQRTVSYHVTDLRANFTAEAGRFEEPRGKAIPALAAKRMSVYPVEPNSPVHVVDRARKRICAARTGVAEISCVDLAGKRTIIRWIPDSVRFVDADRKRVVDEIRASWGRANYLTPAELSAYTDALEFPEWFNAFSVLQLDAVGNFWILERAPTASGTHEQRFRVLSPTGEQIAFANAFPARNVGLGGREFFGATAILRVFEDADGVPKVGVFRIRR